MSYRFEFDYVFPSLPELADWRGHVLDENGYIVCEVWNNGDGAGNFYVWHNGEARWHIEDEALRAYTGDDETKMEYYRETDMVSPMDNWITELIREEE